MNKIMKAISDLNGDLNNTGSCKIRDNLTINRSGSYFSFSSFNVVDDDRLVCTTEEFNDLVSQLETNFGENCTRQEWLTALEEEKTARICGSGGGGGGGHKVSVTKSTETKPAIDWSKAHKGCNYAVVHNKSNAHPFFHRSEPIYKYFIKYGCGHTMICFDELNAQYNTEYYHVVGRPTGEKEKPVYTQAMKDDGEFPKAGMRCEVLNRELTNPEYEEAKIDFVGCNIIVYSSVSGNERTASINRLKFKPLDIRTPKEKAIDDLHSFYSKLEAWTHTDLIEAVIDGKIHCVKWVGE